MVNKLLEEYVSLQAKLHQAFQNKFGEVKDKFLTSIPKTGELSVEDLKWDFQKHGSGVIFTNKKTNVKIDVHEMFVASNLFDQWRLRIYIGSLGKRGVKFISSATKKKNINLDENIKEWFSILLKEGQIEKLDSYYRIKN
jgi:hypothetical protein